MAFAGVETHESRLAFPNTQDIAALADDVIVHLSVAPPPCYGYPIRGHGTYVWGRDLDEVRRHRCLGGDRRARRCARGTRRRR